MKRSEILLMLMQLPIDFVMLLLAGMSAYHLRFTDWAVSYRPVQFDLAFSEFLPLVSVVALVWMLVFAFVGLYSADPNRKMSRDIKRVFLGCTTGLAGVAVYVMFLNQPFDSRFLVAAAWGFAIVYVVFGRLFIRGLKGVLYRAGIGLRRVAVIGSDEVANTIIQELEGRKELGLHVVKTFDAFSDAVTKKLKKLSINELIFTNPRAREKEALAAIQFCNQQHITFKYSADVFATFSSNMRVHPLAGVPVVELKPTPLEGWGRIIKRLFDIVFSLVGIVLTSPLMLFSALVILFETGRPIIYKNERVGIRKRLFSTLKFRSMYQKDSTGKEFGGARAAKQEKELIKKQNSKKGPIYKIQDDPRVTPFGRCIRRWSIDELPQFFNVLGGSMSLVGPRPHQPREVKGYEKDYPIVFTLKPGMTGLAQISGRSDLQFEEEMRLDILYTERWSLWLDLIICIKTPFILFKRRKVL